MNVVTQLTKFVGRGVINKNTTDLAQLAVRCLTGSVELSCVAINTPLVYQHSTDVATEYYVLAYFAVVMRILNRFGQKLNDMIILHRVQKKRDR